ncbi:hypothetical protein C8R48DRAFT_669674 [Suillus tomentosus]|nr:hypothetical protein C8R48DRAFT_669674 [Suillus tomentosus]
MQETWTGKSCCSTHASNLDRNLDRQAALLNACKKFGPASRIAQCMQETWTSSITTLDSTHSMHAKNLALMSCCLSGQRTPPMVKTPFICKRHNCSVCKLMSVIEAVGTPRDDIYRPQPVVVMPRNPRPGLDDGEDFEAEINAIMSDESNSSDRSDSKQSGSDLDQLRLVLAVPGADTQMHEVRKTSPEAKLKGAMVELYLFIPKDLHHSMETNSRFVSLFRAAVSSKRLNILHSIKDCAGIIFSSFKLDPNLFADQPSKKQNVKDLLVLLKRNGEGDYIHLVPVLFMKPNAMAADDFLKSIVLIKIVRVEVFGKAILGGKTRGHPKGRGLRMGAQSVSEGMIAGAAILASLPHIPYLVLLIVRSQAHFLLTHDAELTAIGAETKINYQKDYDFYLECLLKGTPWAISVMEYFNKEVFNTTSTPSTPISTTLPAAAPRTWEDDFLQELDNLDPVICHPSPARSLAHAHAPSPTLSALSNLSSSIPAAPAVIHDDLSVSATMNFTSSTQVSIGQTGVTSASMQVHFDLNQLSLADNDIGSLAAAPAPLATGSKVPTHRGRISAQAAQVTTAADEILTEPAKTKCVSGRSKKATTKYAK